MKNRAQRLIFFLVVWLTMFSCILVRGQHPDNLGIKSDFLSTGGYLADTLKLDKSAGIPNDFSGLRYPGDKAVPTLSQDAVTRTIQANNLYNSSRALDFSIPQNIYYIQSGIMCKEEWQLEKATHIPFRVRIGSLDDCNAMEGKR